MGICCKVKVLSRTDDRFVEASLAGKIVASFADMPFTKDACRIASGFELFRDDVAIERQFGDVINGPKRTLTPVEPIDSSHGIDSGSSSILSTHQSGTSRRAVLAMMMIQQLHALSRQAIDVGCLVVFAAIAGNVRVTQVIRHDENDVGRGRRRCSDAIRSHQRRKQQKRKHCDWCSRHDSSAFHFVQFRDRARLCRPPGSVASGSGKRKDVRLSEKEEGRDAVLTPRQRGIHSLAAETVR